MAFRFKVNDRVIVKDGQKEGVVTEINSRWSDDRYVYVVLLNGKSSSRFRAGDLQKAQTLEEMIDDLDILIKKKEKELQQQKKIKQ